MNQKKYLQHISNGYWRCDLVDLSKFLQKDMVVYLDNISKFGTPIDHAADDETQNLLETAKNLNPQSVSVVTNSSGQPSVNNNFNGPTSINTPGVHISLSNDILDKKFSAQFKDELNKHIEDIQKENEKEKNTQQIVKEKPIAAVKKEIELNKEDKKPKELKEEKHKEPVKEEPVNKNIPPLHKRNPTASELDVEKHIASLEKNIENSKIHSILKEYNYLKLTVISLCLDNKTQKRVYVLLKKAAKILSEHKEQLSKKELESKDPLPIQELSEEEVIVIDKKPSNDSKSRPFQMVAYVHALQAIRERDKHTALQLLVDLSKKYPKNLAIKLRLREALDL